MIQTGTRLPRGLHRGARKIATLFQGDRPIYMSPEAAHEAGEIWLDANVKTVSSTLNDAEAFWFEVAVTLPGDFAGSPAAGWTRAMDKIRLRLSHSEDLLTWTQGGWSTPPGRSTITNPDGTKTWPARYSAPIFWTTVIVDQTLTSDRAGKSITSLLVIDDEITLTPPRAMPADAALLQADLRARGYTGATVTSVSAPLSVKITNHIQGAQLFLSPTMSGVNVTGVKFQGTPISLPNSSYAMPSQKALLQTHLRAAGYSGSVVSLYGDEWTITLPNRPAVGNRRGISASITPGDPFMAWDFFGTYLGEIPATGVNGQSGNVRTPGGDPLQEFNRQFARVGFF